MSDTIAVLADNSRVKYDSTNDAILVEPQLLAFRAAITFANVQLNKGKSVAIALAIDHKGVFRKQFLADGLSNSAKRNPRLSQLKTPILEAFSPILIDTQISPDSIHILHEDSARTHASHLACTGQYSPHLAHWVTVKPNDDQDDNNSDGKCSSGSREIDRVTCAAVTSEYYAKAISFGDAQHLEVFFEDDPWSSINVFTRGAVLLEAFGSAATVRLNLVRKDGHVFTPRGSTIALTSS